MTSLRETPKDHGILLDHDPKGRRRLTVTLAGRSVRRNGRRLQSATGEQYVLLSSDCVPLNEKRICHQV